MGMYMVLTYDITLSYHSSTFIFFFLFIYTHTSYYTYVVFSRGLLGDAV